MSFKIISCLQPINGSPVSTKFFNQFESSNSSLGRTDLTQLSTKLVKKSSNGSVNDSSFGQVTQYYGLDFLLSLLLQRSLPTLNGSVTISQRQQLSPLSPSSQF